MGRGYKETLVISSISRKEAYFLHIAVIVNMRERIEQAYHELALNMTNVVYTLVYK